MYSIIFIYNIIIIDGHFYIYIFNSLKSVVRILLGKKYKFFLFYILCSIILDSLVFVSNNSLG